MKVDMDDDQNLFPILPKVAIRHMKLKNRVCLITGSSRGIGASIAQAYAEEGAKVVITYRNDKQAALQVAEITGSELVLKLDVCDKISIAKAFREVSEHYGRVDVLVNNAGVNRTNDFDQQTEEEWDFVLNVNLKGVFLCCQEVLKYMPDGGRVINIGSISGEYGGPRTPSYAAAKMGVMSLTHCLARFVGSRNICVNCLSPGVIANDFAAKTVSKGVQGTLNELLLLKRMGTYSDLNGAAIFLASEDSSYMTAQTLSINGGAWVH